MNCPRTAHLSLPRLPTCPRHHSVRLIARTEPRKAGRRRFRWHEALLRARHRVPRKVSLSEVGCRKRSGQPDPSPEVAGRVGQPFMCVVLAAANRVDRYTADLRSGLTACDGSPAGSHTPTRVQTSSLVCLSSRSPRDSWARSQPSLPPPRRSSGACDLFSDFKA